MAKKNSMRASLMDGLDGLIFTADEVERIRVEMMEMMICREDAALESERVAYCSQGFHIVLSMRIMSFFMDYGCFEDAHLREFLQSAYKEGSDSDGCAFFTNFSENSELEISMLDALAVAARLSNSDVGWHEHAGLIWRLCYRILSISAAISDFMHDASIQAGRRGGSKSKPGAAEARHFANEYLWQNCLDSEGVIRQKKYIAYEVCMHINSHADDFHGFQLASKNGVPTERAIKTVCGWIRLGYADIESGGLSELQERRDRMNRVASEYWEKRKQHAQTGKVLRKDGTPVPSMVVLE